MPKWAEPDLPITAGTRSGNRKRTGMRYNRFLIDKIRPDELGDELLSVGELVADDEWQIINDSEHYPKEDYSTPEQTFSPILCIIRVKIFHNIYKTIKDLKNEKHV